MMKTNLHAFVCLKKDTSLIILIVYAIHRVEIKYHQSFVKKYWTTSKAPFCPIHEVLLYVRHDKWLSKFNCVQWFHYALECSIQSINICFQAGLGIYRAA